MKKTGTVRVLLGLAMLVAVVGISGVLKWYFIPLLDVRIHACVAGIAALYIGIAETMAWNTISHLNSVLGDAKHLSLDRLQKLVEKVRSGRHAMQRKLGALILSKGLILAAVPVVFDKKISLNASRALIWGAYMLIIVGLPVLWSVFRNHNEAADFRDQLALEAKAEEERLTRAKLVTAEEHLFESDSSVKGYYETVEPEEGSE
jgi:hypothetical protein